MTIPVALAAALNALSIDVTCRSHPALRTVADAHAHRAPLRGAQMQNLFLKDAAGQLWLVVVPGDPRMDTKVMAGLIGSKRISFGSADLLGVDPGSVTPLAVMNDTSRRVRAVLHAGLMAEELVLVHALVNTATVPIAPAELLRFMTVQHEAPAVVDLTSAFSLDQGFPAQLRALQQASLARAVRPVWHHCGTTAAKCGCDGPPNLV